MSVNPLDMSRCVEAIRLEQWRIEDIEENMKDIARSEATERSLALSKLCKGHREEVAALKAAHAVELAARHEHQLAELSARHAGERQALQVEYTARLNQEKERANGQLKAAKAKLKELKSALAEEKYQLELAAKRKATAEAHRAKSVRAHGRIAAPGATAPDSE